MEDGFRMMREKLVADENNVFAGGDLATGSATVISCVGHQKIACAGYR
jgi:NADPH-dependent glutamate synthase beta subunit-like oxidoreductase